MKRTLPLHLIPVVILALLLAAPPSEAGVTTLIEFEGGAQGGENPDQTIGFTLDSGAGFPQLADEMVVDTDNLDPPGVGQGSTHGIAEITEDTASFAAQNLGIGRHSTSSVTTVTQQITNDGTTGVTGTYQSLFQPGGGLFFASEGNEIEDFDAGLGFSVDIALDGTSLFSMSVELLSDGSFNQTNAAVLNDFEQASVGGFSGFSWTATEVDLDLGFFDVGQTKELVLTMQTQTFDNTGCTEFTTSDCLLTALSIGDPPGVGYGQVMLYSLYLPPEGIPEPGALGLLVLGLSGLLLRRRLVH